MATIRDQILEALVARLATIPTWNAQQRLGENRFVKPVTAIAYSMGTSQVFSSSDYYDVTMQANVEIAALVADADDDIDGNGTPGSASCYRYLDRLIARAEKLMHSPDSWPNNPGFSSVQVDGHDIEDPPDGEEHMVVRGALRLIFKFRQAITDPEVGQS